jgi:hypothetical protein
MLARPPPSRRAAAAERQRRSRGHRRAGEALYRVWASEWDVVEALVSSGRLTEAEALQRPLVERALAAVLIEWAARWRK